jgi:hypothetical protein
MWYANFENPPNKAFAAERKKPRPLKSDVIYKDVEGNYFVG